MVSVVYVMASPMKINGSEDMPDMLDVCNDVRASTVLSSEEEDLSDEGDLTEDEVDTTFSVPYQLSAEAAISLSSVFVLDMCGSANSGTVTVAVSLSDRSCAIYDAGQMRKITSWSAHSSTISNIKFSPGNDQLLYSASRDGCLKLWDMRISNKCVKEFKGMVNKQLLFSLHISLY